MSDGLTKNVGASRLWRPYAALDADSDPITVVRGKDSTVWDDQGRRYLDATAGQWYCAVGWGREEIVEAIAAQLRSLHAYTTFGPFTAAPAEELAARLATAAPVEDGRVFLVSGGSDAVDSAVKLARHYWFRTGRGSKRIVISRAGSYHGLHGTGTALAGIPANREGYAPDYADTVVVAAHSAPELQAMIDRLGADSIAAFIAEPVIGVGGIFPASMDYWSQVQQICRDNDVLFIVDEVITAFGRLGHQFASNRYDLRPDILTFAKAVTSGYAALGGVIVWTRVQEPFRQQGWRHGYTFSGHATACVAALTNLRILDEEHFNDRVEAMQDRWAATLAPLAQHSSVFEVRAAGLLAAVELSPDLVRHRPGLVDEVVAAVAGHGVLTRSMTAVPALQLSPPLCITDPELDTITEALDHALAAAAS